ANRWTVFRRVTLPLAAPALSAGAVLCWARALGEFGATITFAGNYPGTTQTMPLAVYLSLESSHPERGIVISLVLLVVSLGVLDGAVLDDRRTGEHVPAEQRPVGVVFQQYVLFPHLSALENVAFGLRSRGVPKATARARAAQWLDRVGLAEFQANKPKQLSGG